ncbi:MAG: ABC transporter ATP-binding protein/permease, partial [Bacteroidetes bacterium RIFCSPHIGHO2_02_FULL_44_7]
EFAYRIPRIRLEALNKLYAPELMNRFFDVVTVQKSLTKVLIDFSTASIQIVFGLILLSIYHPFFIVFGLILMLLVLVIIRLTARKGLETSLDESKHKYKIAHWLEELARTHYTFKLAGETCLPMEEVNRRTEKYIDARDAHFSILVKQYALMVSFKVLVALGLLVIGGVLVMEQQMNVGQFVAAEIIILLVIASVEKLVLSFETIYDMLTALEKIGQVTDLELEGSEGLSIPSSEEGMQVSLQNVSFSYEGEKRNIVRDISFEIQAGERLWISGQSDSGKSTLLYLIGGLYRIDQGSIALDGIPLGNYHPQLLRKEIGGYLRDEQLFDGTFMENITLGREGISFEDIRKTVASMGLDDIVRSLSNGYDTQIERQGRQFSKSTIARVLLARAIVNRPRLLLLENSFSVFSAQDRKQILEFLLSEEHAWTVVLTSSQNQEIDHLIDRKIVLENGTIKSHK